MRSAIAVGLEVALDIRLEDMREELRAHLALPSADVDVVFSPSGTDSQLHALFLARSLLGARPRRVVVGADQTGSGTPYTARGRHFSRFTASGAAVRKDTPIAGLAGDCVAVPLADASGLKTAWRRRCRGARAIEAASRKAARVLLHIMDSRSSAGARRAQPASTRSRAAGPKVQVVVDACQTRLGRRRLRRLCSIAATWC